MSTWLLWMVLSALTGSPIGAAIALLIFGLVADRFTLGLMPTGWRWFLRRRREGKLQRLLLGNPHDRQSRRELAELWVMRGAHARAVQALKTNLEAGDTDHATVFTMGVACMGAGHQAQGEKLLEHLAETQPDFRVGELHFAIGRARLNRKDFKGAREALERAISVRRGTVEGRVLLAQALLGSGDEPGAALMRDEAWKEYVSAPGFQRRKERLWAWRARPSRPATYGIAIAMVLILVGRFAGPALSDWASKNNKSETGSGAPPRAKLPDPVDE